MFSCDDPAPVSAGAAFVEEDVNVETGIRIGAKFFPHLVSTFTHATDLVARHVASNGRSFEKAFSGRQAVMWLRKYQYASTQVEAVGIGNAMLSAGVFHPLESDHGGFECKDVYYRMVADMDISKELKRGARKDVFLKLLGFDRAKSVGCVQALQSPWFEDQVSFSFTSATSGGSAVR